MQSTCPTHASALQPPIGVRRHRVRAVCAVVMEYAVCLLLSFLYVLPCRLSAVAPVVEAAQAGEEEQGLHTPLGQHHQQQVPGHGVPGAIGGSGATGRADGGGGSTGGRAVHGLLAPDT